MDQSFFAYLELLELLLFFSGYPLVYLLIKSFAEFPVVKRIFKNNIIDLLPVAYAIVAVLFLGLQLKNMYPDFSFEHLKVNNQLPFLKIWALLSVLFFIPLFNRKPVYSLLHSLVFFYFIIKDLFLHITGTSRMDLLKNDMNIYSYSLLINLATFLLILFVQFGYKKLRNNNN